jgi:crossover junction endodeoxyribonuclease RuvC
MRILGVDPGLTRLGVGVIDNPRAKDVSMVDVTVLTTPTDWDVSRRLHHMQQGVAGLLDQHKPDVVVIERVFAQHNVRTVMGTAQVSGIVMALSFERDIGGAKKPQVGAMVKTILGLAEVPKPADAADALALAITEAWRGMAVDPGSAGQETPAQRAWREALVATKQNKLTK